MALSVMLVRDEQNGAIIRETVINGDTFYVITLVDKWGDSLPDDLYEKLEGPALYLELDVAVHCALRALKEIDGE